MSLQSHQAKILKDRWQWEGEFNDLCHKVAEHIASAESTKLRPKYLSEFESLLVSRKFSPNTPTWCNAGRDHKGSLSACFVKNIEDNMESITEAKRWMAQVQKYGGGTGFDLSYLRPRGTPIRSTHGKACGPIAVLKSLAGTSQLVTQGGVRDGANMAVLSVYHKDVMDFINLKAEESYYMLEIPRQTAQQKIDSGTWTVEEGAKYIEYCRLNGLFQLFNVSIAVDNAFMEAVQEIDILGACTGAAADYLPCGKMIGQVWEAIVTQAWASGDPGLLFIERAREFAACHSPLEIRATNPCGEQWLPDDGSCNLGSVDLSKFVLRELKSEHPLDGCIDWVDLKHVTHTSVRFLDNVVEVNQHADPGIAAVNKAERRIGLGIMGWADMLLKLGVRYDENLAMTVLQRVGEFFMTEAHEASVLLAKEKGAFPLYDKVKDNIMVDGRQIMPSKPRRNATVTTVAPTGTISLMAGCSSGIEPHFLSAYVHSGMREHGGLGLIYGSETIQQLLEKAFDKEIINNAINTGLADDYLTKTCGWKPANQIPIEWHIKHQTGWQKFIDNSISKTLNLSNSATKQDVANAYRAAYSGGCKGSTVYRDGCKPMQVLNAPRDPKPIAGPSQPETVGILEHRAPKKNKRPRWVPSETVKIETAEGDLYITITHDDRGMPFEIFAALGKGGTSAAASVEALNRTISIGLRHGLNVYEYVKQLRGIKSIQHGFGPNAVFSVPDAIGQVLEEYMVRTFGDDWAADYGWISHNGNGHETKDKPSDKVNYLADANRIAELISEACPQCGSQLVHTEGCHGGSCIVCGFTKCS